MARGNSGTGPKASTAAAPHTLAPQVSRAPVIVRSGSVRQPGMGKSPEAALLMQGRWRRRCDRRLLMPWDVQLRGFRVVTVIW